MRKVKNGSEIYIDRIERIDSEHGRSVGDKNIVDRNCEFVDLGDRDQETRAQYEQNYS